MNSKLSSALIGCILIFNSTDSAATLLLGSDLSGFSGVAGAALIVSADSVVSDNLGAQAAIAVGARSETADIYSSDGAVGTGDSGNSGDLYSGAAVSIAANSNVKNVYAKDAVTLGASGSTEDIYAGAAITLGATSTSQNVYAAAAISGAGADSISASYATANFISAYENTFDIDAALEQMASAQESLYNLETDFNLSTVMGDYTFEAGVYSGAALTIAANSVIQFDGMGQENPIWVVNLNAALDVGAGTKFAIINAGAGASVIWNLGGALTLGAGSSFIGTAFITGAATGATSDVTCGNLFTTAAIGIASMTSTNCLATDTWAGSINGFAYNIDITDNIISNKSLSTVSEPPTSLMIFSVALMFITIRAKRKS